MAADAPEMVVLTGNLPKFSSDGASKCLGVYKKTEVSGCRPTYVKVDDANQFLTYHILRWRFGRADDLRKGTCDICCGDDDAMTPDKVSSSWKTRFAYGIQSAPGLRLHALLP